MVGFDVRWFPPDSSSLHWALDEREKSLLRLDVVRPLSVDRWIWPSRFQSGEGTDPELIPVSREDRDPHFALFGLWSSLPEMLAYYRPASLPDFGVGFRLVIEENAAQISPASTDEWLLAIQGSPVKPAEPDPRWGRLGFDVANSALSSGVSGFTLLPEEREPLRRMYAGAINHFGLFGTAHDAIQFCRDANQRLADDGPFYVWELFLIWGDLR
jgi:hypothetical protein